MSTGSVMIQGRMYSAEGRARPPARMALAIVMIALIMIAGPRAAQPQPGLINRAPKIKAVYIYKFISYVEWPPTAFANPNAPLVVAVVGADPVNPILQKIAKKKKAGTRPMVFRTISKAAQAKGCHIIFFGDLAKPKLVNDIIAQAKKNKSPVLTIGEVPGFVGGGGAIEFFIANNKIRIKLSRGAYKGAGLKISSQLAKIAKVED